MSFDISKISDYLPLKLALEHSRYMVISDQNVDNDSLKIYIKEAENAEKMLIFYQVTFLEVNITNLEIYTPILFYLCNFTKTVKFTSCNFFYQLFFHSTSFINSAKFKLSSFNNGINFLNCLFKDEASFERVKFLPTNVKYIKKELLKLDIKFPDLFYCRNTIDFLGVKFFNDVSFINSNFGSSILFTSYQNEETIFYKESDFSCIVEEKESLIINSRISQYHKDIEINLDSFHRVFFQNVKFYGEANFENRLFQKKTSFFNSSFYKVPKFHNCTIHQDTDFRGTSFLDTYSEGAEHAYRTLKLIMNKKRARREEMMFFALEQKSVLNTPIKSYSNKLINNIRFFINDFIIKSISESENYIKSERKFTHSTGFYVSLTEKIISFVYLILSNYGQSIKRPIVILIINLFLLFPLSYRSLAGDSAIINHKLGNAYHLSFQQLFRPFELYTVKFVNQYEQLPFVIYLLATFESLSNMGLFALFILAIRGRFKMY